MRIDTEGAYANLVVPSMLARSGLDARSRAQVTELVYGTTRMRRACDWLVDRFLVSPPEPVARNALRLGAYQLAFLGTPPHAAVGETVAVAPPRARGLVNAVLRRVAATPVDAGGWPSDAVRLSYPDWLVERLVADLGPDDAFASLAAMDEAAAATERADGYTQDLASQWVAALVEAGPGDLVADLCAAPGGKATALAGTGARVVATDLRPARARLVAGNAARLGIASGRLAVAVADGTRPPLRPRSFDRVLVDAPCTGLGTLRRRPDLRWRVQPGDGERLARLQVRLIEAGAALVRPGGVLVFSVCTLGAAETTGVDGRVGAELPGLEALPPPGAPWRPHGRGALLLPHRAGTDGMAVFRYVVGPPAASGH